MRESERKREKVRKREDEGQGIQSSYPFSFEKNTHSWDPNLDHRELNKLSLSPLLHMKGHQREMEEREDEERKKGKKSERKKGRKRKKERGRERDEEET